MEKSVTARSELPKTEPSVPPGATPHQPWTVTFVVPTPKATPSDRIRARAELVKSALYTGGY